MKLPFYKYQATGNDFVMIDNRTGNQSLSLEEVRRICNRKFGVGSDGLILIEQDPDADFRMVYYNADGTQSLCANGCRSAVNLASLMGMVNGKAVFNAYDGKHEATLLPEGEVRLQMNDVNGVRLFGEDLFINTGSPHYIRFVKDLENFPVVEIGREIRNGSTFEPDGTNVNFVEQIDRNTIFVRTYERGVEDETLSCGTGATAAALAAARMGCQSPVSVKTMGGDLSVEFKTGQNLPSASFHDIALTGPAKMVFKGDLEL